MLDCQWKRQVGPEQEYMWVSDNKLPALRRIHLKCIGHFVRPHVMYCLCLHYFEGLMNRDYEGCAAQKSPNDINHYTGTGMAMSIAANRVSYMFNLTGPSLSIDCACSSSLVAIHLGCQALKQGRP